MRALVVTDEYPWPARTGYRQRIAGVLEALAATYDVDLLAVVLDDRDLPPPPPGASPARVRTVIGGPRGGGRGARLLRWVAGRRPRSLLWRDWTAARAALAESSEPTYDVVWFSHAPAWLALEDLIAAPQVVDLDNLESFALRHRRRAARSGRVALGPRVLAGALADGVDERRWRHLERRIADRSAACIVCSDLDRRRLDRPSVQVVPNGYEPPPFTGTPGPPGAGPPVLLMVGLLTYEANQDAAAFFAEQVFPLVRDEVPDARFRVVGRFDRPEQVAALQGRDGVEVAGGVPEIGPELAAATVSVAPIRFGGGTRIKILEAFAWGLPVVATSVGAEGLAVRDGEHLLLADDPQGLARACVRVLTDDALRGRLTGAGRSLWEQRYRWRVVGEQVRSIVDAAAAAPRH